MRRMLESTVATLMGGLILWWVTSTATSRPAPFSQPVSLSQPSSYSQAILPLTDMPGDSVAPTIQAAAIPSSPPPSTPAPRRDATPSTGAGLPVPAAVAGPAIAALLPAKNIPSYAAPAGSLLLYENFSQYREGDATDWGPNTSVKTGLDRRNWLVSGVDGSHPVGRNIRLPGKFQLECRYAAGVSEVTRGILGWWKEPLSTKISFVNDQGAKYVIEWAIGCGNDVTRLNPLGSPSLCAKKYYHTIKLPDGTAGELGAVQPTGVLRIDRDNKVVKVFIDGQTAAVGALGQVGQLVGFRIDVVKAKNGTLFFTDFKIAR